MNELKPCAFCGSEDADTVYAFETRPHMRAVTCNQCAAEGPPCETDEEAIAAWNRRATDGQRAGVPELTEQMIDAARPLFLALECGATSIEDVRGHLSRGGMVDIDHLPEWFRTGTGHLTKAGRAIIAWHLMLAAAPTPPAGTVFGIPAAHALLEWNRLQSEPPIKIGREYDVAKAYVAMMAPARDAGQEAPEERIESLFRNRMTPYGLLVRALRIVAASSLYEMAQSTGRTPAELSAVEMGRKPATPELASLTAKFFADKGIHGTQAALMVAVEASKGEKG